MVMELVTICFGLEFDSLSYHYAPHLLIFDDSCAERSEMTAGKLAVLLLVVGSSYLSAATSRPVNTCHKPKWW